MQPDSPPVFDTFAQDVYAWAYRLLGRHHDALDVVQDVFLKWTRQCADRPPDHPRGWLRRVTLNDVLDRRRATHSTVTLGSLDEPAPASPRATGNTEPRRADSLDTADLRHDIAAALERVSELQRGVLIAKVFDDLTFATIAEEMDVSISTVKTHYLRAVRALRDRLQHRWGDSP